MKKILVISTCPIANDGLTKIMFQIIEYNKDIKFSLATGYSIEKDYCDKLSDLGVNKYVLPKKKNIFSYQLSLLKLIRQKAFDAVYIHGNSAMMFIESFPARLGGAKVITHCHNTSTKYPVVHYLVKPFFNASVDVKIGCSELASKWAYCGKNIYTVVNGVDINKFIFDNEIRDNVRKELGWEDNLIVGHIGRMTEQKNHKKLVDVFSTLVEMEPRARLLLIGDGELKEEILNDLSNRGLEKYTHIISSTYVPQNYMNAMDVMVMPSFYEGLCLVAIEAQVNGVPLIIDERFSRETLMAKNIRIVPLESRDNEWAQCLIDFVKSEKHDSGMINIPAEYEIGSMKKKIRKLLI